MAINIIIDSEKLAKLITKEITDVLSMPSCVGGEIVIGKIRGVQISIVTNADKSEHSGLTLQHRCVTEAKK